MLTPDSLNKELLNSAGRVHEINGQETPLSFALNFISGRGLLTLRDRQLNSILIKLLELEIPNIAFPFDVTGGSERFKTRRCKLMHLVFSLGLEGLSAALSQNSILANGFVELHPHLRDGCVELSGRFKIGEAEADFTIRASIILRSPEELGVVFYDTRVYGVLPVPAALLPVYLGRALNLSYIDISRAGVWIIRPVEHFIRNTLPQSGWKIPDTRSAHLVAADVARGRITIAAGPEPDPTQKQINEREPPAEAVIASEGIIALTTAERALARGDIPEALQLFRDAFDEGRGGRWARLRLLQIGAADPTLAQDTRQLAEEALSENPKDIQALLALAALALRDKTWGEAANRFGALADIAHERKERTDIVTAELAAAAAATPVDPTSALAAYERAAARARDSIVAHRALFSLRLTLGDWSGAVQAGERLLRLLKQPEAQAVVHRELGKLQRLHLHDFKQARSHFERALRLCPEDPDALEGLAETYAARGEPGRAASYLARLAEQAEGTGDISRIIALNLRLGNIWERWLADPEAAAARYYRVLDADPKNRQARLRLAYLAENKGELIRARVLYEDILASEEGNTESEAIPDIVATYTRLARVTFASSGPSAEAVACLERAVEIEPANHLAREELAKLLRLRGEWGRLIHHLADSAAVATSPEEARQARLDAARLEIRERHNPAAAEPHLTELLKAHPDDDEALELLVPLLENNGDIDKLVHCYYSAAQATLEPERKAQWLLRIGEVRQEEARAQQYFSAALDANPYLLTAATALVAHAHKHGTPEQKATAFLRLAVASVDNSAKARALFETSTILWRDLGRPRDAEAILHEATLLASEDVEVWIALATIQEENGQLTAAREALENALPSLVANNDGRALVHTRLAEIYRRTGDAEGQAAHLLSAMANGADTTILRPRLIQVLSSLGRQEQLADLLESWAVNASGDEADSLRIEAAGIRESNGQIQRALDLYRTVLVEKRDAALTAAKHLEQLAVAQNDAATVAQALAYQLELAFDEEAKTLLTRLLKAEIAAGNNARAESCALRLLELDPRSALAHQQLAEHYEINCDFGSALKHWLALIYETSREENDRTSRRQAYSRAAALALDIGPEHVTRLRDSYDRELPEAPPTAITRSLSEIFTQKAAWEQLLALRRYQIETFGSNAKSQWRRDAGDILHRRLNRSEEAISYYQDVIAHQPDDTPARECLIEILDTLKRDSDLASLLFAMSQLISDGKVALEYGLRSANIYATKLADDASALQVLRLISARADIDPDNFELQKALRQHGLLEELSQLLERSIGANPDPEDNRFNDLITLLSGPLNDASRAIAWCERMIEAFPVSDIPRQNYVNLVSRNPELGDPNLALSNWAKARAGKPRANVLFELAKRLFAVGETANGITTLEEAANADPTSEQVLTQLVDRATAAGDFLDSIKWLEKLAIATDPGQQQDALWRRIVQIACDYTDDTLAAANALENLTSRTESETRLMVDLLTEHNILDGLTSLTHMVADLPSDLVLKAGASLANGERLEPAKLFLEQAMARGHFIAAWDVAEKSWRKADQLEALGHWRLQAARRTPGAEATVLKLFGYADLIESGLPKNETLSPALFESLARDIDTTNSYSAWALFRAARGLEHDGWIDIAVNSLSKLLTEDDPRLLAIIHTHIDRELAAKHFDVAAKLADRLLMLGDQEADEWMEKVLTRAGRRDDLLRYLLVRAESVREKTAPLWVRIAGLYADAKQWTLAIGALERVPQNERSARWGALLCQIGVAIDDPEREAQGATVCAELTANNSERANWLRRAGRLWWWRLNDEERGHQMLQSANKLVPWTIEMVRAEVNNALQAGHRPLALRLLAEALVIIEGADAGRLSVLQARIAGESGDNAQAANSLTNAFKLAGDDVKLLASIAESAQNIGLAEITLEAYRRASALSDDFEIAFLQSLENCGEWNEAAERYEKTATDKDPNEAARRLTRAAEICVANIEDVERALKLFLQAIDIKANTNNLAKAFALALKMGRTKIAIEVGESLLEQLAPTAKERAAVLRAYVDALDADDRSDDTLAARQELVSRSLANAHDKLVLGRLYANAEPERAAPLFDEAASDESYASEPMLLFEAACLWQRIEQKEHAILRLKEALENGADELSVHLMAIEILDGSLRLRSLEKVIAADADATWPTSERAKARVDIASDMLANGDAKTALAHLEAAAKFEHTATWAQMTERALASLNMSYELALLWLNEIEAKRSPWSSSDSLVRLQRAALIFRKQKEVELELRTLDTALTLDPKAEEPLTRIAELAVAIGDQQRYISLQKERLEHASDIDLRLKLVSDAVKQLLSHFKDPEAAVDLALPEFETNPTIALIEILEQALIAANREDEIHSLLKRGALNAATSESAALWSRAAEIAIAAANEDEAFECYRQALAIQPALLHAHDFCLAYAKQKEKWDDALTLLEQAATLESPRRALLLADAAKIVFEHIHDSDRELVLLRKSYAADASNEEVTARLAALCIEKKDLVAANKVIREGVLSEKQASTLVPSLIKAFREENQNDDAESIMQWFSETHSDTSLARDYRLQLARKHGDAGILLNEISARLSDTSGLQHADIAPLRLEAARAAIDIGEQNITKSYLDEVVNDFDGEVNELFAAWQVAALLSTTQSEEKIAQKAVTVREEIFAKAASANGVEQIRWLELLGQAHMLAGEEAGALGAFAQVLLLTPQKPPRLTVAALSRIYQQREEWHSLLDLYEKIGIAADTSEERVKALVTSAEIWHKHLNNDKKAEQYLRKALTDDPKNAAAQLLFGMLLWARKKYTQALPFLKAQVDIQQGATVDHIVALADCMYNEGDKLKARNLIEHAIDREPTRADLYQRRAEILEATGDLGGAEAAWLHHIEALGSKEPAQLEPLYRRLARIATKRGDPHGNIEYLEHARRLTPDNLELIGELRSAYELANRWSEAAELRLREASLATDPTTQAGHFRVLAQLYRDRLDDSIMGAAMLEKASELTPTDQGLIEELLNCYQETNNWSQFVVVSEKSSHLDPSKRKSVPFLLLLSQAYEQSGDILKAKEIADEAVNLGPPSKELKARQRDLAQATGDYKGYAASEEIELATELPDDEKLKRLLALADIYVTHLNENDKAVAALEKARELNTDDKQLTRRLADIYALDASTYSKAANLYRHLLADAPLDIELLRILARLSGQLGDTDRAYGYYAALLSLASSDEEAQRFVNACRSARPIGPQRPLTDADRSQGLLHPGQASSIEEVFTPLARFAELTQAGNLERRGITSRDLLGPTDPRRQYLLKILEPLGLPQAEIYIWRSGAQACEIELVNPPAILIGSILASDTPERQRAFLVARMAELYRSGHILCEKLGKDDLSGLLASLCIAVDPQSSPSGANRHTPVWSATAGAPMTQQIRNVMGPRIASYLKSSQQLDINEWRHGCLATASRTAMLVGCDIEEAVTAILRLHGFDDMDDDQRIALLREAPEELDLMRFAISEQYFKLRQSLGLALRRSK